MPSSYDGAEQSVDAQRQSALEALAQFGRRGLEAAVVAQREGNRIQSDSASENASFANDLHVGSAGQAELAALTNPGREAYAANGAGSVNLMQTETDALGKVQGNYYNQVKQAVPMERVGADQIVDQYKAAYAQRQADAAAQAELQRQALAQAALQAQMQREEMERQAALFRLLNPQNNGLVAGDPALARAQAAWQARVLGSSPW